MKGDLTKEENLKLLLAERDGVDFQAFNLLRFMNDEGVIYEMSLVAALTKVHPSLPANEAQELATTFVTTFKRLQLERSRLDQAIVRLGLEKP